MVQSWTFIDQILAAGNQFSTAEKRPLVLIKPNTAVPSDKFYIIATRLQYCCGVPRKLPLVARQT
jgi:hypothetical protein